MIRRQLQVDEEPAGEGRALDAADHHASDIHPRIVPGAAQETAHPADRVQHVERTTPRRDGLFELVHPVGVDDVGVEVGDRRPVVVEERAEARPAAHRRGRVVRHDVEPLRPRAEVVREEPELGEVRRARDPLAQQSRDLVIGELERLRLREAVRDRDAVVVERQLERVRVEHGPGRQAERLLGRQLLPTSKGRHGRRRGDRAAVDEVADRRVEHRRHVEGVLLPRRRRAEAGAPAGAQGDRVADLDTPRDLPRQLASEVGEVFPAQRGADRPRVFAAAQLNDLRRPPRSVGPSLPPRSG